MLRSNIFNKYFSNGCRLGYGYVRRHACRVCARTCAQTCAAVNSNAGGILVMAPEGRSERPSLAAEDSHRPVLAGMVRTSPSVRTYDTTGITIELWPT